MPRLLEGIKVLELGSYVAVPAAGTILADLGAEVVKVGHPVTGRPGPRTRHERQRRDPPRERAEHFV